MCRVAAVAGGKAKSETLWDGVIQFTFPALAVAAAENGEAARGAVYDDGSANPLQWSPARVRQWVGEHRGGKYAAMLQHDAFFNALDGEDVLELDLAALMLATDALFAYMSVKRGLQRLVPTNKLSPGG